MKNYSIFWKEKTIIEKWFDDELEFNVLHHALYDGSGTELIWDDTIVWEAILRIFFRKYPDVILDLKIDFKAGVQWGQNICK